MRLARAKWSLGDLEAPSLLPSHFSPTVLLSPFPWESRRRALARTDSRMFLAASIVLYLGCSYLMMVCSNVASYLSPRKDSIPVLPDLGFAWFPFMEALWLTDLFVHLPVLYTFAYIFLVDPQPIVSTCKIGHTLSIAYLLRSASMLVTGLPDPRPSCQHVMDHFLTTFTLHRCGDCMFSGHASVLMVLLLYWLSRVGAAAPPRGAALIRHLQLLTILCFSAGILVIIGNRAHYTVDVLVALYTVAGIWWSHAHFWQRHVTGTARFPGLNCNYRALGIIAVPPDGAWSAMAKEGSSHWY